MKIFFIRHGEADPKLEGAPLTEKGIIEADSVAKELLKYDFDKAYYSDLIRAKDTANSYLKLNREIKSIEDSNLREVYRILVGGPIKEGTSQDREKNDKKRADKIFEELLKNNENVIVFCHGNIIRYYLNKILKSKDNIWESLIINNGSISIIESEGDSLKIKAINLINHLPENILSEILSMNRKETYLE